ncbi:cytoglobin-1-like isoform X1 [Ostrinia nubilalis]|uniref:cytoglobin-1-like isoform X2 n=1 Tax=Ostrinia furnacalis TaxID=93504 RepID=UPI00103C35AC|nr:cytoglobin-1-like isoform X2 [Ostrinia furnacalis]
MLLFVYLSSIFMLLTAILVLKKSKHPKLTMGAWLSYIWWGGDPDAVNPVSGLTKREIYAVQKSWAPVYANSVANGTEILNRLFTTYPETKNYFKMIRNLPDGEYAQNFQFKAHVINLMSALNLAIMNLNQPEIVAAMMVKLGESHKRREIKEQNFHDLKNVLVKMFIEVLNLDAATLGAWGKTVDFWYKNIFQSLNAEESR